MIHASQLYRIAQCPGSYKAEQGLKGKGSAAAASGTKIHKVMEKIINLKTLNDREALDEGIEIICAQMKCDDRETMVVGWFASTVFKIAQDHGPYALHKESKMVVKGVSGTLDLALMCGNKTAHVVDYKSGWAEQGTSEASLQGKLYVILLSLMKPDLEKITFHLIAAGNDGDEFHTDTSYSRADIQREMLEIDRICSNAEAEITPRIPGEEQCQYCKAAGTEKCPESIVAVQTFEQSLSEMKDPKEFFLALASDQRGAVVDSCLIAASIAKKVLDMAKECLREDPESVPGFEIGKGSSSREIKDPAAAFDILQEKLGFRQQDFFECVKVQIGKIAEVAHALESDTAENADCKPPTKISVKRAVDAALESVVERTERSGSLKRIKA